MTRKRTLLLLGGSRYALPVIRAAHGLGARVITCDYLPDNYAHRFSDGYVNASIADEEAVLAAARSVRADGIMSFAADPGVVSAAYAAERLGLPYQGSYEAVSVLQDKGRFRDFLRSNGFSCPWSFSAGSVSEVMRRADELRYPVIVKPVDRAGSKGVSRVDGSPDLAEAVARALALSLSGRCIVEQYLGKRGCSSDSDCFCENGLMTCVSFSSQLFDDKAPNPFVPSGFVMPSRLPASSRAALASELQRLCDLLHLRSGVFNVETRVGEDGTPYLMEVSPRGGGNRLSELLRRSSGVDLVRAAVQAALGMPVEGVSMPRYQGIWYEHVLHARRGGIFCGLRYAPGFREARVAGEQVWVRRGERVHSLTGANRSFGTVTLRFDTTDELDGFLAEPDRYLTVEVCEVTP